MHIHRVIGGAAALAVGLSLASCASPGPDELRAEGAEPRSLAPADATALPDVTAAVRAFGLAVLSTAPKDANAVVSPASLASAFAMLAEGARGESSTQLDAVLGASGSDRSDAFAAIRSELAALDGDPAKATADELPERPILHLASRVVVDERIDPREEYLAALVETFDAGTQRTDLTVPGAKEVLSSWVRHHSGGLIQESAIRPNDLLRLVLQDVALLAARWDTPFRPDATSDDPFTLSDGSVVDVETMHTGAWFAYAEEQGWAAVRLPYTEAMHADILLPPEGVDPADAAPALVSDLTRSLDAAETGDVDVALPTVDTGKTSIPISDALSALGLGSLACGSPDVDLSGIAGEPGDLCVGQAVQQAVLQVDEEGTVAAAVTEIGADAGAAPSEPGHSIAFDRPFLFTISHTDTGWPLFQAAVRDPRH